MSGGWFDGVRRCFMCGCSQFDACEGGCHWVAADLCSSCVDDVPELAQFAARFAPQIQRAKTQLGPRVLADQVAGYLEQNQVDLFALIRAGAAPADLQIICEALA